MPHFKLSKKISTFLKIFLAALLPAFALTIASLKNGAGFIFEPWQLCEIENFFEEMILKKMPHIGPRCAKVRHTANATYYLC